MRTIADEMADARNLGSALPIAIQDDVASDSARAAPVELVVTEERCTICVWPEVCEADSTCWEENRRRRIEAGVLITRQPPPPAAETDVAAGRQEDDDQLEEVDEMIDVRPLCKVPGCPNERHDRSGLYGAICLEHKRERQAAKAVAKASPAVAAADTPSDASPAHGVAGGGAGTDPPPGSKWRQAAHTRGARGYGRRRPGERRAGAGDPAGRARRPACGRDCGTRGARS